MAEVTDERTIVWLCENGHVDDHHVSIEGMPEQCSRCGGQATAPSLALLVTRLAAAERQVGEWVKLLEKDEGGTRNIHLGEPEPAWGMARDQMGVCWVTCHGMAVFNLTFGFQRAVAIDAAPELCPDCGGTREAPLLMPAPRPHPYIGNWHGPPGPPCISEFHGSLFKSTPVCDADEETMRAGQCTDVEIAVHLGMHREGMCPHQSEAAREEYERRVEAVQRMGPGQ